MATNTFYATVATSLPIVGDKLQHISTSRLILRPLLLSDLDAFHLLRTEPAAMSSSGRGRPDNDINETKDKLRRLQPPYHDSHVYYGIFLKKDDGTEGDLIGDGGVHKIQSTETGWPEFGYKFKEKHWGKGYATEFANAFLNFWWNLPRKEVTIQVHSTSLKDPVLPVEQLCAWTKAGNMASERVLQKVGFEPFQGLDNDLKNWKLTSYFFETK